MSTTAAKKPKAKLAPPSTLDELSDEAGALGDDLGYILVECAQCGVEVPGELAARAELTCGDLAELVDCHDRLIPRPGRDGQGRKLPGCGNHHLFPPSRRAKRSGDSEA
jgi:hypothetical protein